MHKLAKGLKKKKKPKKGKKGAEEDEFDPEELERYRRERAVAQEKASAAAASAEESGTGVQEAVSAAGSDEWQKFQALTAGVDSILKKTQGDLDRIKSTSFFQRKAPVEDQHKKEKEEAEAVAEEARNKAKRWIGFDKEGNPIEGETKNGEAEGEERAIKVNETGFVEIPDDEEDEDDSAEEDIFDTTYVDVLQNIDVQLAYIPDSPSEEDLGDDPFDTSNADKVLKTVDKKGNRLVSLGNAVEVLSGRVDHVSTCKLSRPRKAPRIQNLLLDEDAEVIEPRADSNGETFEVEKTLLDDDADIPDVPIDLTSLPQILPKPESQPVESAQTALDISEFEAIGQEKTLLAEIPDLDEAEFDLGERSDEAVKLLEAEDPFGTKDVTSVPDNFQTEIIEAVFEGASFVNEEDPFDTTFAENILPGKTELKFIEKELEDLPISSEVSISLTDPAGLKRDYETGLLSSDPASEANIARRSRDARDLLAGSRTDLEILNEPIVPSDELTYVDPFDTSSIQDLPPGRTELKFLERELLGQVDEIKVQKSESSLEDEDFDPRQGENKPPPRPDQSGLHFRVNFESEQELGDEAKDEAIGSRDRRASRPEVLGLVTGRSVNFELPTPSKRPDLLQTSEEEKSIASTKPLTPYYSQKSLEETLPEEPKNDEDLDPFDTSFVGKVAPGKTELKLIESELLESQECSRLRHSTSVHEIESRSHHRVADYERSRRSSDFGSGTIGRSTESRVHRETGTILIEESEIPSRDWDIEDSTRPHHLEKRQVSILDAEVEVDAKPLTPRVETRTIADNVDEIAYADPFDTSIAINILPGKAELKLLENELSELPTEIRSVRVNAIDLDRVSAKPKRVVLEDEDDFDPRASENGQTDFLSIEDHPDPGDKVLTPLNNRTFVLDELDESVDPFDTSFASIGPGKTELKILESELMDK